MAETHLVENVFFRQLDLLDELLARFVELGASAPAIEGAGDVNLVCGTVPVFPVSPSSPARQSVIATNG
jgi:hypothetical protein